MSLERWTAQLDDALLRFSTDDPTPGVAVGLVHDGQLVHVKAVGSVDVSGNHQPDADSVFRIASMTKSFTAATTLALRDQGVLRLDDPVATWLPHLGSASPEGVTLTVRHLLTMTAGFATDDPWGDRQQPLPLDRFDAIAAEGFTTVWTPGTQFEYSNLGYALLGRVLSAASGQPFDALVTGTLLEPLGLSSTTFHPPTDDRMVQGYALVDHQLTAEPLAAYGAFSPMGGLFSTVRDLARWVQGFVDAERGVHDEHPLAASSRREMSQTQRFVDALVEQDHAAAPPRVVAGGYGFGLVEERTSDLGRIVSHSGGYPGFGSHMRWHPDTGLGVVALGNRTYAPMRRLASSMLNSMLRDHPVSASTRLAGTESAARAVAGLIAHWDDDTARSLFADNVDADEPLTLRRATLRRIVDELGPLAPEPEPPQADSPAHRSWWMSGPGGRVKVELQLSPQPQPRVQLLTVTPVPTPEPRLTQAAERLVAALNDACPSFPATWPEGVSVSDTVDPGVVTAQLRAVAARLGSVGLGPAQRHESKATSTIVVWRLLGERGRAELQLDLAAPGTVTSVAARFAPVTTV